LLGEVIGAVDVPVLAAGGIGTGRAMAAALAARAEAAARDIEIGRDERIALGGADGLAGENDRLARQVAGLTRAARRAAGDRVPGAPTDRAARRSAPGERAAVVPKR
jgi:hypothetical protein